MNDRDLTIGMIGKILFNVKSLKFVTKVNDMAAEKLTKARLIQIILTFIVLMVAFFWRTATHEECTNMGEMSSKAQIECESDELNELGDKN